MLRSGRIEQNKGGIDRNALGQPGPAGAPGRFARPSPLPNSTPGLKQSLLAVISGELLGCSRAPAAPADLFAPLQLAPSPGGQCMVWMRSDVPSVYLSALQQRSSAHTRATGAAPRLQVTWSRAGCIECRHEPPKGCSSHASGPRAPQRRGRRRRRRWRHERWQRSGEPSLLGGWQVGLVSLSLQQLVMSTGAGQLVGFLPSMPAVGRGPVMPLDGGCKTCRLSCQVPHLLLNVCCYHSSQASQHARRAVCTRLGRPSRERRQRRAGGAAAAAAAAAAAH